MFFAMKLGFPKLNEQDHIVDFIEEECQKIDLVLIGWEKQIQKLKEYKTTLINDAVTGKIKVA